MNNTQRAIELAIEGGWEKETFAVVKEKYPKFIEHVLVHEWETIYYAQIGGGQWPTAVIFLDQKLWQSLGKVLGLENHPNEDPRFTLPAWLKCWHSFIDTLAEGKTAEDFFTQLLANK